MRFDRLAPLVLFAAACTTNAATDSSPPGGGGGDTAGYEAPDGIGSDDKSDTLYPTGGAQLGKLTLKSPTAPDGLSPARPSAYYVQPSVVFDTPNQLRVAAGQRYVALYMDVGKPYDGTYISIAANRTTELSLAGLHLDHFRDYETTIGIEPEWKTSRASLQSEIGYAGINGLFLELIAQPFSLTLQADKPIARFDLQPVAGKVQQVDVAIDDPRMTLRVLPPEREFRDARSKRYLKAMLLPAAKLLSVYGDGAILRSDSVALVDGKTLLALGNDKTDQHYNLYLNGTWTEVKGKAGELIDLPIRRLDVRDVLVTDDSGESALVIGTYSVEWAQPTAWGDVWLPVADAQSLETESGIDVVPGTYRVTVSYPWHNQPSGGQRVYQLEIK